MFTTNCVKSEIEQYITFNEVKFSFLKRLFIEGPGENMIIYFLNDHEVLQNIKIDFEPEFSFKTFRGIICCGKQFPQIHFIERS